jgi:hypothetical protein
MVVCHLHVVSLKSDASIASFLAKLRHDGVKPVFQARILRWMILPRKLSAGHLLARNTHWDLLLALRDDAAIPPAAQADIAAIWTAPCGVSGAALSNYANLNATLLHPPPGSVQPASLPALSPSSSSDDASQNLSLSPEWLQWIAALPPSVRTHPVSMLNLLAFNPGKKEQYAQYGAAFSKRVGSRHGGHVKLVGRVVDGPDGGAQARRDGWEEIAYVHYPTIEHFAAMAGSRDYQEVNKEYRLGALRDTFILCCQEVDGEGELLAKSGGSKL